ncbi:unnamed protein product [Lymnaea stagnalis]|uniref:Cytosolic endo-beta-N-acetylglucosaminidase TIM barrel domain-containing protein n=1 Tax=Lymnaea stagnalis TaxID=6523 RepID=A0AAV2IKR2_LYMST
MQSFVRTLTTKCHELLDSGQVLWYDSVTSKGDLRWQDELNSLNKMFFDVCDGIYLNYNITEEKLARSRDLAALANRQFDVYVGIDVFGRGSPCGGGFNTKEGLEMIRNYQLSCALFAPAWTYEYLGYAEFDVNEIMFWGIISDLLTVRPLKIPIHTTFCQGFGNDFFLQGQKMNVSSKPWFNISLQQLQPSYLLSQFHSYVITSTIDTELDDHEIPVQRKRSKASYKVKNPSKPTMFLDLTSAVNGGSSLKLQALNKGQAVWFKLFKIDADNSKSLKLTVCWKSSSVSRCDVFMVLSTLDADPLGVGPVGVLLETVAFSESRLPFLEQASKHCLRHISTAKPETESMLQDYRKSSFMVDMNEFVKRGYKDQEFLVSAVLLPLGDPQMAVNIGLLEVVGDSEVKPRLNIMKAIVSLGKQLELPLSFDRIIGLITQVNTSYQDILTAETRSNSVVSADATVTAMSSARTSVTSENSSFASESSMVYFFKWIYSNQADVDYYLVSGYDMAGKRTILGHCVTENFIYTHALNDAMLLPDHFSIEPVLSSTDSPAGEFLFYAEGAVPRVTDLTF